MQYGKAATQGEKVQYKHFFTSEIAVVDAHPAYRHPILETES